MKSPGKATCRGSISTPERRMRRRSARMLST